MPSSTVEVRNPERDNPSGDVVSSLNDGNPVTAPVNLVEEAEKDDVTAELVRVLRRQTVGTFQFLGDLRTLEAALRAAFALRELLQADGLDIRVMTEAEKKKREEARLAPTPVADPVTVDTNPQPASRSDGATSNKDKA